MLRKAVFTAVCVALLLSGARGASAQEAAAVKDAQTWLSFVDSGLYERSWDTASAYFKSTIDREKWVSLVKTFRVPLGKLISRQLKAEQATASLPGIPDGQYDVIVFETVFENKASTSEMVTMSKEKDGSWSIIGYVIR